VPGSLTQEIERSIREAETLHTRLILIVGSRSGKSVLLRDVHQRQKLPLVNVNLHLSEKLLDLPQEQRPLRVADLLREVISTQASPVVLLDNLELLFDPELRQDPLRLLEIVARRHTVVAAWPGEAEGTDLMYADPGHPEHRRYARPGAILVRTKPSD
jgi:hypothetical protein